MSATLPTRASALLDAKNLVVLTTLNEDGSPHSTPVWALRDGDDILLSTVTKRRKAQNLARDPRASVVVTDPDDPATYFSINGSVTITPDDDKQLLNALSNKYLGGPYPVPEGPRNVRVRVRLTPTHVIAQYAPAT